MFNKTAPASFTPALGTSNAHLQTLLPTIIGRCCHFTAIKQRLELEDGDFIDLIWSEKAKQSNKPVFILFHGLEGCFNSPYAQGLMQAFVDQGWLAVVMHFRGCSGESNRLARSYHSGETEDARFVLEYIHRLLPTQPKVAVGISLGGNMLANYLAKYNHQPLLDAATLVSAPLNLHDCASRIQQGFSRLYQSYLLTSLKRNAKQKLALINTQLSMPANKLNAIKSLYEFDDLITAPLHGFTSANHYYQRCSGINKLLDIGIATQIIHAADDPFMTSAVIPDKSQLSPYIDYQLVSKGGHVGFISGTVHSPQFWLEHYLTGYYQYLHDS